MFRPIASTWVASMQNIAAPDSASELMWVKCQSVATPSSAEYWHIGDTMMGFFRVRPRSLIGENRALMPERPEWEAVTFQQTGAPVSSMLDAFEVSGLPLVKWGGPDIGRAHGGLFDHVVKKEIRHRPQPVLDVAAQTAVTRPIGDGV